MSHVDKCHDCGATDPGRSNRSWARGLCSRCYKRRWHRGTLPDCGRVRRSRDEVIEDWLFLAEQGYTRVNAAERMGMKRDALDRAIARAKRAGDPRLVERKAA